MVCDLLKDVAMNSTAARKIFLKVFIAFLSLTALVAILSVLSGDFGEIQIKILATTFSISAASICSMSSAAFMERRKRRSLGLSGIYCAAFAALLVICGVWGEIKQDEFWKVVGTVIVFAIALAHAFLLVLPELDERHRWTQKASSISIGVLSLQIVAAIWGEIDDGSYYKLLAVVSIFVVLLTLVIPILMKMRKGTRPQSETLILSRNEEGIFIDSEGVMYEVKTINSDPH